MINHHQLTISHVEEERGGGEAVEQGGVGVVVIILDMIHHLVAPQHLATQQTLQTIYCQYLIKIS